MTEKEKKLLITDLAARTAFGVMVEQSLYPHVEKEQWMKSVQKNDAVQLYWYKYINEFVPVHCVKPYLRPMSSMTKEEQKAFDDFCVIDEEAWKGNGIVGYINQAQIMADAVDFLNAHHFDFRGLIEKGLAIEAPKDMYK